MSEVIETGVDRLVRLIKSKGKISVADAAKELGVSVVLIEEWADFLEEEGNIDVEYKFTTPYLVEKKLDKSELKKKIEEFHGKKDGFVRKAEVALANIEKDSKGFDDLKKEFEALKEQFRDELSSVKVKLEELEKYEKLKRDVDSELFKHNREVNSQIEKINSQIEKEKERFRNILSQVSKEEKKIIKERMSVISLKKKEDDMEEKINSFKKAVAGLHKMLDLEEDELSDAEKHVNSLLKDLDRIKDKIQEKISYVESLEKESKKHQEKISKAQEEILKKIKSNEETIRTTISEGKNYADQFRKFFERKNRMETAISNVEKHKHELESELSELIKRAKVFKISSKSKSLGKEISEIESAFLKVENKKKFYESELKKLIDMIKGKDISSSSKSSKKRTSCRPKTKKAVKRKKKTKKKKHKK